MRAYLPTRRVDTARYARRDPHRPDGAVHGAGRALRAVRRKQRVVSCWRGNASLMQIASDELCVRVHLAELSLRSSLAMQRHVCLNG